MYTACWYTPYTWRATFGTMCYSPLLPFPTILTICTRRCIQWILFTYYLSLLFHLFLLSIWRLFIISLFWFCSILFSYLEYVYSLALCIFCVILFFVLLRHEHIYIWKEFDFTEWRNTLGAFTSKCGYRRAPSVLHIRQSLLLLSTNWHWSLGALSHHLWLANCGRSLHEDAHRRPHFGPYWHHSDMYQLQ